MMLMSRSLCTECHSEILGTCGADVKRTLENRLLHVTYRIEFRLKKRENPCESWVSGNSRLNTVLLLCCMSVVREYDMWCHCDGVQTFITTYTHSEHRVTPKTSIYTSTHSKQQQQQQQKERARKLNFRSSVLLYNSWLRSFISTRLRSCSWVCSLSLLSLRGGVGKTVWEAEEVTVSQFNDVPV